MPIITLKSKVRTASEHCSLSLNVQHRLLLGQLSDPVFDMKTATPEAVDVLLYSNNLSITVSGSLDGTRITPAELKASHIASHLLDFLQTNARELGINAVSDLYISEDTHLLSLTITASQHCPTSTSALPVHLKLMALDLDYVWQTNSNAIAPNRLDGIVNPFARHLSLPYLTATDCAVGRFVSFHLVRRYPLIFGLWCKQLDVERTFFPSILISIQNIMERSRNPVFQATCQKMFKLCKREVMSFSISAAGALSKYLDLEAEKYSAAASCTYDEEEAFVLCLERCYRLGMKRPMFKHRSLFSATATSSSEDLLTDLAAFDVVGVDYSSSNVSEASSLLPHVSLFEGIYMDGCGNVEDARHVTPLAYRKDSGPQGSLNQMHDLMDASFGVKWAELSDQDSCDDIYDLDNGASYTSNLEQYPWCKNNYFKDGYPDLVVDSCIGCFPELEECGRKLKDWWSPDTLAYQEYDQDSLGRVSSPKASLPQPLKILTTTFEDLPDLDHHIKHNPNALVNWIAQSPTPRSLAQTEDIIQVYPGSQESLSDDHYLELESDMGFDLTADSMITDDDHGIVAFDFAPNSIQEAELQLYF